MSKSWEVERLGKVVIWERTTEKQRKQEKREKKQKGKKWKEWRDGE